MPFVASRFITFFIDGERDQCVRVHKEKSLNHIIDEVYGFDDLLHITHMYHGLNARNMNLSEGRYIIGNIHYDDATYDIKNSLHTYFHVYMIRYRKL